MLLQSILFSYRIVDEKWPCSNYDDQSGKKRVKKRKKHPEAGKLQKDDDYVTGVSENNWECVLKKVSNKVHTRP